MPRIFLKTPSFILVVVFTVAALAGNCRAATETTILTFPFNGSYPGGEGPYAGLISDAAGNLFGTTFYGGMANVGVVFELVPSGSGTYKEVVLYSFRALHDCNSPMGRLLLDSSGNLFGVAIAGCEHQNGGVFELSPIGGGKYGYTVIYPFPGVNNGQPDSPVSLDAAGNLYGAIGSGGPNNQGQIYKLTPNSSGGWIPKTLYNFGHSGDGLYPVGALALDAAGNIYGATIYGGMGNGTVYELSPAAGGSYKEKILHNFQGSTDGASPFGGVILDPAGNLYGTTNVGGNSSGNVYRLSLSGSTWVNQVIHSFDTVGDGATPSLYGALTMDSAGNIYGATDYGGADNDGIVYKLTPTGGTWTESILYSFTGGRDGSQPNANLLLTPSGNILGTAFTGGGTKLGTVFEITP
jgi:uncharacterized repeat protein (TIGR03803 family)